MDSSDSPMPDTIQIINETARADAQSQGSWRRTLKDAKLSYNVRTCMELHIVRGNKKNHICYEWVSSREDKTLAIWALVLLSRRHPGP
jgi:hypothetical protein